MSSSAHAPLHQQVVDRAVQLHRVDPETDRQRALRVEVHQQHLAAVLGERRAQIDGRGGLADPALLVAHGDDLRRAVVHRGARRREPRHRPAGRADALAPLRRGVGCQRGRVLRIRLYLRVGIETVLEAQFVVDAVRIVDLDVAGPGTAGHNRSSSTAPSGERRRLRVGVCGFAHLPVILPKCLCGARPPDGAPTAVSTQQCPPNGRQLSTYVFIALTPR